MSEGYLRRKSRSCPECGCEMIFGDLDLAGKGACLEWESRAKYALNTRTIFGKQKTVYKPIRHRLLDRFSDHLYEEYAWYCPDCGLLDVRFRTEAVKIIAAMGEDEAE